MADSNWRETVSKYLRNPIVIFAIIEFFVLLGLVYLLTQRKV